MTAEILSIRELEFHITAWKLIPGSGGKFEFSINGEVLFSKKTLGRHANPGEIQNLLKKHIAALQSGESGPSGS